MTLKHRRKFTPEFKLQVLAEIAAGHKRVLHLMGEDNLLCLRKRRFISTTDSRHSLTIYPNLVPDLTLSSINQL